jgi:hypothetical protein
MVIGYAEQQARVRRRSWASYTIDMFEFEFPTGTRITPINRSGRSRVPAKLVRMWCMIRANAPVRPKAALHSLPVIAQPSAQWPIFISP